MRAENFANIFGVYNKFPVNVGYVCRCTIHSCYSASVSASSVALPLVPSFELRISSHRKNAAQFFSKLTLSLIMQPWCPVRHGPLLMTILTKRKSTAKTLFTSVLLYRLSSWCEFHSHDWIVFVAQIRKHGNRKRKFETVFFAVLRHASF